MNMKSKLLGLVITEYLAESNTVSHNKDTFLLDQSYYLNNHVFSTSLIPKPVTGHDPESIPSTSALHKIHLAD
jgi:hypothetical protein